MACAGNGVRPDFAGCRRLSTTDDRGRSAGDDHCRSAGSLPALRHRYGRASPASRGSGFGCQRGRHVPACVACGRHGREPASDCGGDGDVGQGGPGRGRCRDGGDGIPGACRLAGGGTGRDPHGHPRPWSRPRGVRPPSLSWPPRPSRSFGARWRGLCVGPRRPAFSRDHGRRRTSAHAVRDAGGHDVHPESREHGRDRVDPGRVRDALGRAAARHLQRHWTGSGSADPLLRVLGQGPYDTSARRRSRSRARFLCRQLHGVAGGRHVPLWRPHSAGQFPQRPHREGQRRDRGRSLSLHDQRPSRRQSEVARRRHRACAVGGQASCHPRHDPPAGHLRASRWRGNGRIGGVCGGVVANRPNGNCERRPGSSAARAKPPDRAREVAPSLVQRACRRRRLCGGGRRSHRDRAGVRCN